jgi:hypothetical protein
MSKSKKLLWLALPFCLLLSGCLTSENAFYEDADVVSDDRIVGVFRAKDSPPLWIVKDNDPYHEKQYIVIASGDRGGDCEIKFTAKLFQVGTNRFLDALPLLEACDHIGGNPPSAIEILQSLTLQPMHMVVKINVATNGIQFGIVDQQGLNAALKAAPEYFIRKPERLPRMVSDTKRLHEFLLRFGGDTNIFKLGEWQTPEKNKKP